MARRNVTRSTFVDLTDQRFARLVVLELAAEGQKPSLDRWRCQCDCGNTTTVRTKSLRDGSTLSCRCYGRELLVKRLTTHGRARTPEYRCWQQMIQRCRNPQVKAYPKYGGRGITVCDEWAESFERFYADMGPRPSAQHSLDRIDNDRLVDGYSKDNCRWATGGEQLRNNRRTRLLTHDGVTLPLTDWAARVGISGVRLTQRLTAGWSLERALTTPADPKFATRRKQSPHESA